MMEIARFKEGVMSYATNHMMPKMDSKGQFLLGLGLGMVSSKMDKVLDNEALKSLGIVSNGQLDYDTLYSAAMEQMQRQGKLVLDAPFVGRLSFDEQDLRDLHMCITKGA